MSHLPDRPERLGEVVVAVVAEDRLPQSSVNEQAIGDPLDALPCRKRAQFV